mmetsp:Transcript_6436/g.7227  ORF Transcript_6436/g.7227 Transcript_6436/m.7227 type:complete len:100 (-) Transcript_6436:167-466(-)
MRKTKGKIQRKKLNKDSFNILSVSNFGNTRLAFTNTKKQTKSKKRNVKDISRRTKKSTTKDAYFVFGSVPFSRIFFRFFWSNCSQVMEINDNCSPIRRN